jgi:hypothetical protein
MTEHITLTEHSNGIHEIKWHAATRQVVDEYFTHIEAILKKQVVGQEPVAYILVDLSQSGAPPFTYLTQQGRKLLHEHHRERDAIHVKIAFLAKDSTKTVLSLAEAFVKLLPIDASFKIFDWTKRHDAEEWLLNNA